MASQFDREARQLERRRQIAEALRASGNEALPASLQTSGRFDAPVSGWAYADRATKQLIGALMERRANKDETALGERQKKAEAEWFAGLEAAKTPSDLQPVAVSGKLMPTDGDPIGRLDLDPLAPIGTPAPAGLQQQMANRAKYLRGFDETQQAVNASDRQRMLSHYMKGGDIGGLAGAFGTASLERELLPPVAESKVLGADDTYVSGTGQVIARGVPSVKKPEPRQLVDIVDPTSPKGYRTILESDWNGEQRFIKDPNSINIELPPEEGAEAKKVGEFFGEQYAGTQKAGMDAASRIARYERMGQLLDGVNTGTLTPTLAQVAALGESLGMTVDESLGQKQALEALANEVALTLRNPSGGAGMPGALSDKDREFLVSMTPGLSKTPEGNRLIIETAVALAKRDQEVAKLAREYRTKHGKLDEGFGDQLDAFGKANPLFAKYTGEGGAPTPTETAAQRAKRLGVTP